MKKISAFLLVGVLFLVPISGWSAPPTVTGNLSEIVNALLDRVTTLEGQVAALKSQLSTETTTRIAADTALRNDLAAETTARSTGDINLGAGLTAEENARITADTAERNARLNTDTIIKNLITAGDTSTLADAISNAATYTDEQILGLNSLVTGLENYVTVIPAGDNTGLLPRIVFHGVNIQLVNGTGNTHDANGLGNIILGYDKLRTSVLLPAPVAECSDGQYTIQAVCEGRGETWGYDHKSGSHNLVIGDFNNYPKTGGLVTGTRNTINRTSANVIGGYRNTASGINSSVTGGNGNEASELYSSVSGGTGNIASGENSSVSGGSGNNASGESSSVSGGAGNIASHTLSSINGGQYRNSNAPASYNPPDYDSGWVPMGADTYITLFHNLGGNHRDYKIELSVLAIVVQGGELELTNRGWGGDVYDDNYYNRGVIYQHVTESSIMVLNGDRSSAQDVRIRMWRR